MQRVRFAPRVGARFVLFVLSAAIVALCAPSVASAATAAYSSIAPKSGSSSLVSTPTITVTVYAARGVKGSSNYALYLDGVKVKPSIKYLMTRYRKFRLTYRRTVPLAPGVHRVTIKVKDLKRHTSSRTWTFTVLAPPPPVPTDMPVTIESGACATCHVGYPSRHPMTACSLCHGPDRPVSGVAFGPRSTSAHTPSCAASTCHQTTTGVFPHVLSADCDWCHTGRYFYIPLEHGAATEDDHLSTSTQCTLAGCHETSLTMEHLRYTVDGAAFTCETCHTSTDPAVARALATGITACTGCHGATDPHPVAATAHALTAGGCLTGTGCHSASDAATLHGGACVDCHGPGRTPSTMCATCHSAEPHPDLDARHAAGPLGCTTAGCHTSDVRTIHSAGPDAPGCGACHAEGKPPLTLACGTAGCHPAASASHAAHPVSLAPKQISISGTNFGTHACSECHALDLVALHGAGCGTCHASANSATFGGGCAQAGCHAAGSGRAEHASIDAAHAVTTATTCVATDCHTGGTNVAAIHAPHGGCAVCHKTGLAPTVACGTVGCHSVSDRYPVKDPHPNLTTIHATGLPGTCAKPGCHLAELAVLHSAAKGCSTCHGAGTTPTAACATSGCHTADVTAAVLHPDYESAHITPAAGCTATGCHSTNAITIHTTGPKRPGCAACHASGKPALTLSCGTTGCHPGVQAGHASHPVAPAAADVTIGGVSFGTHACSECHGSFDLIPLHGGACSTCHSGPATTSTFAGGCSQAGCHADGPRAQHAAVDAAHTLAAAPSCVGAVCHRGGTNLALIHATAVDGGSGPGCAACHRPDVAPTDSCATVGCHSARDPHPVNDPHPGRTAAHTAALPITCAKDGCHASDLEGLHARARACATCHGVGVTATAQCATAGCHAADIADASLHPAYGPGHVAPQEGCTQAGCHDVNVITIHTTGEKQPGCPACHASGKPPLTLDCETAGCHKLVPPPHIGHPVAPSPEPVVIGGRDFGVHACSECHEPLDLVELHGRDCATCHTRPLYGVTLEGGCRQTPCHASGAAAQHATIDADHTLASVPSCVGGDCHEGGANVAALHESEGCVTCHATGVTPTLACSTDGCHGAHDAHPVSAPHPNMTASHTSGLPVSCVKAGCHEADLPALHGAKGGCAICHRGATPASATCVQAGCHDGDVSALHASHPASVAPASIRINGLNLGTFACTTCHASMDLQVIHAGVDGCATCHPDAAAAVGTWDGGCAQAACHGPASARPMHANVNADHTMATQPKCTTSGCHQGNSNVGGCDFALMHFPTAKGCANCHKPGETRIADCASCHAQWATGDHQADHKSCNDCHAPYVWDPVTSTANKGANLLKGLHWPLFDAEWTLSIGRAQIRTGYPKGDYTMLQFPPALGAPGSITTTYFERTATYSCSACHTGAGRTWVHPASNYFTCGSSGDCHEHHYNWDPAQGSPNYVHLTPPSNWTATMRW